MFQGFIKQSLQILTAIQDKMKQPLLSLKYLSLIHQITWKHVIMMEMEILILIFRLMLPHRFQGLRILLFLKYYISQNKRKLMRMQLVLIFLTLIQVPFPRILYTLEFKIQQILFVMIQQHLPLVFSIHQSLILLLKISPYVTKETVVMILILIHQ